MQITVGIGRAIVQDKFLFAGTFRTHAAEQIHFIPFGLNLRFIFVQEPAHFKSGLGKGNSIFVLVGSGGVRHGNTFH